MRAQQPCSSARAEIPGSTSMMTSQTRIALISLTALILSGCGLRFANRLLNDGARRTPSIEQSPPTSIPTSIPTGTPVPTPTATLTPTPNPVTVGLPAESAGTAPLDFAASLCKAEWFTEVGLLPCPGHENDSGGGFALALPGDQQGLPPGYPVLLTYPPQQNSDTIFS